jgi:hypothetical protein
MSFLVENQLQLEFAKRVKAAASLATHLQQDAPQKGAEPARTPNSAENLLKR